MVISFRLKEIPLYGESWNTTASDLGYGGYREGRAKFNVRPRPVVAPDKNRTFIGDQVAPSGY
jgi:hypothetical protein